jgi:8-oxo-dGTP diphosphatase
MKKEYVLGFIFNEENDNVLLMKKLKPEWQAGKFNGIGGKIEFNETPFQAMERETFEEVDIVGKLDWQHAGLVVGITKGSYKIEDLNTPETIARNEFKVSVETTEPSDEWVVFVYAASYTGKASSKEEEKVSWHPIKELPDNCIENLHWLIPMCQNRLKNSGFNFTISEKM